MQAPAASLIIACYNDLLLLDRQRQRRKTGIFILDYGRIEAVIVLPMPCISSPSECLFSKGSKTDKVDNDSGIRSGRPGSHLSRAKPHLPASHLRF